MPSENARAVLIKLQTPATKESAEKAIREALATQPTDLFSSKEKVILVLECEGNLPPTRPGP